MNVNSENSFRLAELDVVPSRNQLVLGEKVWVLQPKVMAVLFYLAQHQDRVISGEELLSELWKGRIVTPGSVQKSMNSLRKALAEVFGDKEVITHFSKRGYQLLITPEFLKPTDSIVNRVDREPQENPDVESSLSVNPVDRKSYRQLLGILIGVVILGSLVYVYRSENNSLQPMIVEKNHQTHFSQFTEFSNQQYRESKVASHPDSQHFAYVRQTLHSNQIWDVESQLMVKSAGGEDWQIAITQGDWEFIGWSPDGRYLVAVERWREDGDSVIANFYEIENYLYTFHIFTLDLAKKRLLEKHLLSQWQGKVDSLTWRDPSTIEFVASQGPAIARDIYRYSMNDELLSEWDLPNSKAVPLITSVKNQLTAVVVRDNRAIRLELLDEKFQTRMNWQLDEPVLSVNWIPDASGVLVLTQSRQAFVYYWTGEKKPLSVQLPNQQLLSGISYRQDGKAIYYSVENPRTSVEWEDERVQIKVPDKIDAENMVFSSDGKQLLTLTSDNDQHTIWIRSSVESESRQLLSITDSQRPRDFIWSTDNQWIVYKLAKQIWFKSISSDIHFQLKLESGSLHPIGYDPEQKRLILVKNTGELRNLWAINTETLEQKQLTFGAVGTVLNRDNNLYFQYMNKEGLWRFSNADLKPELVLKKFEVNSHLLNADDQGIYFVTGGYCRESGIYYQSYQEGVSKIIEPREDTRVITRAYHPAAGMIQSHCELSPSHIMLAE